MRKSAIRNVRPAAQRWSEMFGAEEVASQSIMGSSPSARMTTFEVPPQSEHLTHVNPCVRAFGFGPDKYVGRVGQYGTVHKVHQITHCHTCKHLTDTGINEQLTTEQVKKNTNPDAQGYRIYICAFREEAGLPRIHHDPGWRSCARWERKPKEQAK